MASKVMILRPGDSLSVLLDVPGAPLRLDLTLTAQGVAVSGPEVESLAAVESYPSAEIVEEITDGEGAEISLESYAGPAHVEEDSGIPSDEISMLPATDEYEAPEEVEEIEETDTMGGAIVLDDLGNELDRDGNPKQRFVPGGDDTLPVWNAKARAYKDPELEKKKRTSNFNQGARQGSFTVFLTPPKTAAKKKAAAEIIAELQGIGLADALQLAGRMIVPVAKGVSESDAGEIRDRFKAAGLSCRITQKR